MSNEVKFNMYFYHKTKNPKYKATMLKHAVQHKNAFTHDWMNRIWGKYCATDTVAKPLIKSETLLLFCDMGFCLNLISEAKARKDGVWIFYQVPTHYKVNVV